MLVQSTLKRFLESLTYTSTLWPSNFNPRYFSKKSKNIFLQKKPWSLRFIIILFVIAKSGNWCYHLENGQTVGYLYNGTVLGDKKEQSTDTYTPLVRSQNITLSENNQTQKQLFCVSIYVKFYNRQTKWWWYK